MGKTRKTAKEETVSSVDACFICKKERKLTFDLCKPCNTRLKAICNNKGSVIDNGIANAIRTGKARERAKIVQKLVPSASTGSTAEKLALKKLKS